MSDTLSDVGAFVHGPPTSPRALVRHADLFAAYADGTIEDDREGYLSHFAFGPEMRTHYAANGRSVAGFAGPCSCRWLVLDIDRADLAAALDDARRLVAFIHERYTELVERVPGFFSGGKGFHVLVPLAHAPRPAVGFQRVARTFAEAIAAGAGVRIDSAVYDIAHIIRLANTRHPRTGLFKRRLTDDELFFLNIDGIKALAAHPLGMELPTVSGPVPQLAADWADAERETARASSSRAAARRDGAADLRAPRFFLDFLRLGVGEGERHQTLFRAAAWMTEQGSPPSLVTAVLDEPGRDVGLSPADVARQIRCGIEHALKQRSETEPTPENRGDAWEHPADRLGTIDPAALSFDFGANLDDGPYSTRGGRP